MYFQFSQEDEAFRLDVRRFIETNLPDELKREASRASHLVSRQAMLAWARILARKGWVAPSWPKEHGGPGWTLTQRHIFDEECWRADAPTTDFKTYMLVGPTIIRFGNEEQKKRFLPPMLRGDVIWSQGFSEPNSGSDLASLRTTALRRGDKYIVNGTKIWTGAAHYADWCFLLVRTNTEVRSQDGISTLLVNLKTPGITIRPIITIDGQHHLNQVFLDNVEVPAQNRVGEEGKGWGYAKNLLEHERTGSAFIHKSKRALDRVREVARRELKDGRPLLEDPNFGRRLAYVAIELQSLEYSVLRVLCNEKTRHHGNAVAGVLKIRGSELQQKVADLMLEALGPRALRFGLEAREPAGHTEELREELLWPGYVSGKAEGAMIARAATIYGGSAQVQRNVIAKLAFGL